MQIEHLTYCIATLIARVSRRVVDIRGIVPVGGSGAAAVGAYVAALADGGRFFVKVAGAEQRGRLRAEARGLEALRAAQAARVPRTWLAGGEGRYYFLMLEYLELGAGDAAAHARLGAQLAAQHRSIGPAFGFERDNYIGATPQSNTQGADWPLFWREQRLLPQLGLAQKEPGARAWLDDGLRLAERVGDFFHGYAPQASLLHGDLWPGNVGFLEDGMPVIFDPAVYYGDREADLAMTEMFGGLPPAFHAAYREAWPPDSGYAVRKRLYNLYHLLNHYNLFGEGYAEAVRAQTASLLSELK